MQALETAARDLASPLGWQSAKATSSNEAIATITASSSTAPAALSLHITALAAAHAVVSPALSVDPAATGQVTGPISITMGGTLTTITDVGDGSLNAVAAAVNASSAAVTASVVKLADGSYKMQLTARSTGVASQFTVTGLESLGSMAVLATGRDAGITVGDPLGEHYDVSSSTNSFAGLVAGATITAKSIGDVDVNVAADPDAVAEKIAKLVTAVNDANSYIASQSKYDSTKKKGGPLLADSTASSLSRQLIESIIGPIGGLTVSATTAGISVDRNGTVTFDKAKFLSSYQSNPAQITKLFQANAAGTADDGIAERLRTVAHAATDVVSGSITSAIASRNNQVKVLDDAIAAWDVRLATKEAAYKRQFAGLETALSRLRSQSSWLAGQIASLPS
jgi:flagellar hook-associated protein 2